MLHTRDLSTCTYRCTPILLASDSGWPVFCHHRSWGRGLGQRRRMWCFYFCPWRVAVKHVENLSSCHRFRQGLYYYLGLRLSWGELMGQDADDLHLAGEGYCSALIAHTRMVYVSPFLWAPAAHLLYHGGPQLLSLPNNLAVCIRCRDDILRRSCKHKKVMIYPLFEISNPLVLFGI